MFSVIAAGADVIVHHNELPMPSVIYGVVVLGLLGALGFVTWSYRHVSNRHSHKATAASGHH